MDHRALPDSTGAIVRGLLSDEVDCAMAIGWARDCWQAGFETDAVRALAILEADDTDLIRAGVSDIARAWGLLEAEAAGYLAERWLLSAFLAGALSDMDLLSEGYRLWTWLRERNGDDAHDALEVYFRLDLDAYEITQGDIHDVPLERRRPWVLSKLSTAGAFARVGLQPPSS